MTVDCFRMSEMVLFTAREIVPVNAGSGNWRRAYSIKYNTGQASTKTPSPDKAVMNNYIPVASGPTYQKQQNVLLPRECITLRDTAQSQL